MQLNTILNHIRSSSMELCYQIS